MRPSLLRRYYCAAFALASAFVFCGRVTLADTPEAGKIAGSVTSADGAKIPGALVVLRGPRSERSSRTDAAGRFDVTDLPPGAYAVSVEALGYDALSGRTVGVRASQTTDLPLSLVRSSSTLVTIGRVQTSGNNTLSTSSAPSTTLDAQTYAAEGYTLMSDLLQNNISTTLVHPLGGSTALPTSVALRGPDPTETLVDIDGHQVNNGNTGDFDLSLLDPADYGSVELVKGISPSSLVGPDTIDGAINIRTLEPTTNPHGLLRFSAGSFGSFGSTVNSTGTYDRLGYAVSLHRTTTSGEVNQSIVDTNTGNIVRVGSGVDGSTALGKLRYAFGRGGDGYAEFSFRDQSQIRDLSAALTSFSAPGGQTSDSSHVRKTLDEGDLATSTLPFLDGFQGTTLAAHNAGYGLDIRTPIGAPGPSGVAQTSALFRHYTSFVAQSVTGPGADSSPYLYNDRDRVDDETLQLEHAFAHASLTLQYEVRNEGLSTDFEAGVVNDQSVARRGAIATETARRYAAEQGNAPALPAVSQLGLGQTQRSAVLRYTYDPLANLHVTAAGYYSNYSSFGTSLDPRFGLVFSPDARTVVRSSVGTTYQAPQLPELFVPPVLPEPVGGYVSIGNPNLRPDRATEYGLGVEHVFDPGVHRTTLGVDFYRVNLRAPASTYVPPLDPTCGLKAAGGDGTACPLSYPINAGDAIYQGFEIAGERRLAPFTTLTAGYAVRSAYVTNVPAAVQDGTLVVGEQSQGLPLQKATLAIVALPPLGLTYEAGLVSEGAYNELNQPPFTTLEAGFGYRWRALELGVHGTNLTNVYDRRFTQQGGGVAYAGLTGPLPSDAYALQGTAVTVTLAHRF